MFHMFYTNGNILAFSSTFSSIFFPLINPCRQIALFSMATAFLFWLILRLLPDIWEANNDVINILNSPPCAGSFSRLCHMLFCCLIVYIRGWGMFPVKCWYFELCTGQQVERLSPLLSCALVAGKQYRCVNERECPGPDMPLFTKRATGQNFVTSHSLLSLCVEPTWRAV